MLHRQDGAVFTTGRSLYSDRAPGSEEPTAKIFVKIGIEALPGPIVAQLDTGAAWSMLDAEVAEAMDLVGRGGEQTLISTRVGRVVGRLEQTDLEILADDGDSLTIQATVWVSAEWHGGNFLGYAGLLQNIRLAVDPSDNSFYFGPL